MVYVPRPGYTPLDPPPSFPLTPQIISNRRLTRWFISTDPTPISLIPVDRQRQPDGGFAVVDLPPRPLQRFKIIAQGLSDGVTETQDGQERKFPYVLVGEWDATVHIGDFWEDPDHDGQFWKVTGLYSYNGYETKFGVTSFGGEPVD